LEKTFFFLPHQNNKTLKTKYIIRISNGALRAGSPFLSRAVYKSRIPTEDERSRSKEFGILDPESVREDLYFGANIFFGSFKDTRDMNKIPAHFN
jgi:hypothetical protein